LASNLRRPSFEALLTAAFVLAGVLWGGFLGLRQINGLDVGLDRVEYLTLDWRFLLAGVRPAPRGVVIAAVDDETLRELGGFPVPRDALAKIVAKLASYGPQAIAIDMLFLEPTKPESDAALGQALRAGPAVVGAVGVFDSSGARWRIDLDDADHIPAPANVLWPIAAIRDAARTGLVNLTTDNSGVPRFAPMIFQTGDALVPSFALAAASTALNTEPVFGRDVLKLAARTVHLDLGYHLPIRYYGPRGTIRQFSIAQVLRDDFSPDTVHGQVVVIGATALGTGDTFAIPFDRVVPGVEIMATAVSNLLAGDGLVRSALTRGVDAAAAMLLPGLLVLLLAVGRPALGMGLAGIILGAWLAAIYAAFLMGFWLSIAVPLAALLPVVTTYGVARLVMDRNLARRLTGEKQTLARFQSPLMLAHILSNPQFLEQPVQQDIPVIFLDLSGFTGVAETLGPQWTRDLLADFQACIDRDVVANGGYVANFAGDGAMIIFGLPAAKPDDASRALRTIIIVHQSIKAWLATLPPAAKDRLSVRIGGHFGPVILSRLGALAHQHITATGDTVNVANRLLEITRQHTASVIVTEDLWNAASAADRAPIAAGEPVDVDVRGRAHGLRIRVLGEQGANLV
jgi:adenylate cyclase